MAATLNEIVCKHDNQAAEMVYRAHAHDDDPATTGSGRYVVRNHRSIPIFRENNRTASILSNSCAVTVAHFQVLPTTKSQITLGIALTLGPTCVI